MTTSADELLRRARGRIWRVGPQELDSISAQGGLLIDIRTPAQRSEEGEIPGAVCVERNVFEWRLDPAGPHRIPEVSDHDQPVIVICSEGYASSLAAAILVDMGYERAGDLVGGYRAWHRWFAGRRPLPDPVGG